jgi:hypothetical protein
MSRACSMNEKKKKKKKKNSCRILVGKPEGRDH